MNTQLIEQDGRKRVVLDLQDYQDLIDIRDASASMRDVANGTPTFTGAELDAYLAAPTPLAFWRRRARKTQVGLAAEIGVSQPFLAQIEAAVRTPSVEVLIKLARALDVRLDDLVA